ncbi:enhancer of rudimentary homolog isoform X2 [Solenopsis invicta]|uniref:enhancer of rudimentary homolog isoform X2 n=1 Tax=Solenopsis invicta TaxID=13686 RepID=UPI00193E5851|nr:enhancer of rudimentary homolog isoform X2 [Solenopsis invicta]
MAATHESFMEERFVVILFVISKHDIEAVYEYNSVHKCMEGICKLFEDNLKNQKLNVPLKDSYWGALYSFIELMDMFCLVKQKLTDAYIPCEKYWIKENLDIFKKYIL